MKVDLMKQTSSEVMKTTTKVKADGQRSAVNTDHKKRHDTDEPKK